MYVLAVRAGPAPTARRRSASKNVPIEENASRRTRARASTAGSMRIARRPSARRRAATAATARGRTRARARRSGLARTAAPRSVTRNARMGEDVWHQIRASARPSGTATIVGCPSATRANLRPMGRRRPGLACPKTNRLVWIKDRGPGPCIDPASSRSGATRRRALIVRNRRELTPSWRPSPVRTIYM